MWNFNTVIDERAFEPTKIMDLTHWFKAIRVKNNHQNIMLSCFGSFQFIFLPSNFSKHYKTGFRT